MTALGRHLQVEVPGHTVDTRWLAASARLRPKPVWRAAALAAAAGLLVVAGVGAWVLRPAVSPLGVGQGLIATRATVAELPDGSRVELGSGGSVLLHASGPERVEVALREGAATFEVTRRPSRRFSVVVDDVEIAVVGTRFTVRRELGGVVTVEVERGLVDVHARGTLRRLAAGEQWRGPTRDEAPSAPKVELPAAPQRREVHRPRRRAAPATPPAEADDASQADRLFEKALAARSLRRWQLAADTAERFLAEHPEDSRAGLMAFELGRTLADHLGRPDAALDAYATARRLDPDGDFIEDLLVRGAQAAWATGDVTQCERLRDEYLRRFRDGQLAAAASASCRPAEP